nr:hypothetical protein [Tanacetum cinerariifolium]
KIFGDEFGDPRVIPSSLSYPLFIIGDSPPPSPYSVNSGIPRSNQSQVSVFSSGSKFSAISSDKFGQCSAPISSIAAPNKGIVPVTKASAFSINVTDSPTTSYAKLVTSKPTINERFANTTYSFFLGKRVAYPVVANYVRNTWSECRLVKSMLKSSNGLFFFKFSSKDGLDAMLENDPWGMSNFARAMIELRAVAELKDTIMVAMPKLVGERFYMCIIRVKYECKAPRCSCYKVFDHVLDKCPKNIGFDVAKNLKNPRQAARGVSVGPKVGFKAVKQVYRPVSCKNTTETSDKKKKDVVSRKESSKSAKLMLERQIISGKLALVDDDGNPLHKVVSMANVDSDSEVKEVVTEHAGFLASKGLKRG